MANLKAMLKHSTACFEVLSDVLKSTNDIVSGWMEENYTKIADEANFYRFFAMLMRSKDCKDWYNPDNHSE